MVYAGRKNSRKDYNKTKKLLTDKYGEPKTDKTAWEVGHLAYCAEWETNNTEIKLTVFGDSFVVNQSITYKEKID